MQRWFWRKSRTKCSFRASGQNWQLSSDCSANMSYHTGSSFQEPPATDVVRGVGRGRSGLRSGSGSMRWGEITSLDVGVPCVLARPWWKNGPRSWGRRACAVNVGVLAVSGMIGGFMSHGCIFIVRGTRCGENTSVMPLCHAVWPGLVALCHSGIEKCVCERGVLLVSGTLWF